MCDGESLMATMRLCYKVSRFRQRHTLMQKAEVREGFVSVV